MDYIYDFINPVDKTILKFTENLSVASIGKNLVFHQQDITLDFKPNSIVLLGVPEDRNAINNQGTGVDLESLRKEFYKLYAGNWHTDIYDLGDVKIGATFKDTEVVLQEIMTFLLKEKVLSIIIGGSQALTYSLYRSFDKLEQKVNLTVVDAKFDLGSIDREIDSQSYLTKIVMDKPNNLFNFTNIAYQTFLNPQEEITLLKTLLFDLYRLGEIKKEIELVEPTLRDTDVLSIDLGAIRSIDAPANANAQISGLTADDICKITRYAGLSDKLTILGVFEYNVIIDDTARTDQLIAQMIWYYIEGVNLRSYEFPSKDLKNFKKYMVVIDDETYVFYKSDKSGRWWMEINVNENNKLKRQTLIPCTYSDYLTANRQEVPERWFTNRKKLD